MARGPRSPVVIGNRLATSLGKPGKEITDLNYFAHCRELEVGPAGCFVLEVFMTPATSDGSCVTDPMPPSIFAPSARS